MNNIINKCLLAGDKFMPVMHLRQPQFIYSACGPFTKHKQRIQKFKETGDTNYIYKNELDKVCFAHDAAYSDSKELTKRTVADKILRNRAFNIAKDPKYDGYQRGLVSMVYMAVGWGGVVRCDRPPPPPPLLSALLFLYITKILVFY